jgi:sterol desaturase/sphingolipid hydroxylase (fatty acid hydroxylase superfamily)
MEAATLESSDRSLASRARALPPVARVFAVLGFPLLLAVSLWATVALHRATGMEPGLAIGPVIALAYLFLAIAERLMPWHESWLHSQGDLRTDIGLFITNGLLGGLAPLFLSSAALLGAWVSDQMGSGLWPTQWPLMAQLALALVVSELVEYSVHRSFHEIPGLWRFHATHHSAPRLYWLNAVRFHPIDLFLVGVGKAIPLGFLGAGGLVIALVNLFSGVHGAYQHANVPVRLGPLNWIFSMTELHRWHHSPDPEEANHNYGGNLIIWDVIFGTRWLPADREPPEAIGIRDLPAFPMGFWANLASPFRWKKLVAESAPRRAE